MGQRARRIGPYLHDGSIASLGAAVAAHRGVTLGEADLANLVAYLGQIGSEEAVPPAALPIGAVKCAGERGTCTLPSGTPATVYYGANGSYTSSGVVSGSIACNNTSFGNPLYGTGKACYYVAAVKCAIESATCTVPAGTTATVLYGANGRYIGRVVPGGTAVACNNTTFTDPLVGSKKACWLRWSAYFSSGQRCTASSRLVVSFVAATCHWATSHGGQPPGHERPYGNDCFRPLPRNASSDGKRAAPRW